MQIISQTTEFELSEPTAVAIGKFDGVHVGHRRLLEEILMQKKQNKKACVFTFSPAPSVFFGRQNEKEISTKEEKRRIFASLGVDILIEFPMNSETAAMAPADFITKVLVKQLNAAFIAAGSDVSFGAKGAGKSELLLEMSKDYGYEVKLIDKVCIEEKEVSSTYVRETVEKGDMILAEKLLGAPFGILGEIVMGNQMGRNLGFPTINIVPQEEKLLPPNGVYFSSIEMDGSVYNGISNIGYKPTVDEKEKRLGIETFIYDFDQDVYGKKVQVLLYEFHRPEMKFASLQALKEQLQKDILWGRKYLEK